jgi:hypothetical protein
MNTIKNLRRATPYLLLIALTILAAQSIASAWVSPGTRTPGYWMNHPDAWPVDSITIGGITYTKAEAITLMKLPVAGDKTLSLFPALVAAELNRDIGNEPSCVWNAIAEADAWLALYPPLSGVKASSDAWKYISPWFTNLDEYNNGLLCAPPADD